MPRWFAVATIVGWLAIASGASAQPAQGQWRLHADSPEAADFRGVLNLDAVGPAGNAMLYPAAGAAGLLAAILTHGAIVESVKSGQKRKAQEDADAVLQPYRETLARLRTSQLLASATRVAPSLQGSGAGARPAVPERLLLLPVFLVAQDERALILDVEVAGERKDGAGKPVFSRSIRIVSTPRAGADRLAWWGPAGAELENEAVLLLSQALDLIVQDPLSGAPAEAAFRTLRYPVGASERVERAQVVAQSCRRLVLRTLRDVTLSVPQPDDGRGCPAAASAN
jgi:hypothetical protein